MKNKNKWIRARNEKQVEQRINEILEAAGSVFQNNNYEDVTMNMIAIEANFTRSNLYRYFKTREEIFLRLYLSDVADWVKELRAKIKNEMSIEDFVDKWIELLLKQERIIKLTPLLTISLEKNTSIENYRKAKYYLDEQIKMLVPTILIAFPKISKSKIYSFVLANQAMLSGTVPMTNYTNEQLKVLNESNLMHLKIDFNLFYKDMIINYLKGLLRYIPPQKTL